MVKKGMLKEKSSSELKENDEKRALNSALFFVCCQSIFHT